MAPQNRTGFWDTHTIVPELPAEHSIHFIERIKQCIAAKAQERYNSCAECTHQVKHTAVTPSQYKAFSSFYIRAPNQWGFIFGGGFLRQSVWLWHWSYLAYSSQVARSIAGRTSRIVQQHLFIFLLLFNLCGVKPNLTGIFIFDLVRLQCFA